VAKTKVCVAGFWCRPRFGRCAVAVGERGDFTSTGIVSSLKLPGRWRRELSCGNWRRTGRPAHGDAKFARDIFRAEAHVDVGVGIISREPGIRRNLLPPWATMDMDSVPPATMTSAEPCADAFGARAMLASRGAEAVESSRWFDGHPARKRGDAREFMPCSPSGMAQPRIRRQFPWRPGGDAGERFLIARAAIIGARWRGASLCRHGRRGADGGHDDGFWHAGPRRSEIQSLLLGRVGKKHSR